MYVQYRCCTDKQKHYAYRNVTIMQVEHTIISQTKEIFLINAIFQER